MIFTATLLISFFKLLLAPAYKSTDFEVHRNWLAITHSLPIKKWYFDNTSEWTLDYPPLFAWFEYLLSFVAVLFDKNMLDVHNLYYESYNTILFQRLSVIFTDLVYAYGIYKCMVTLPKGWRNEVVLPLLLITNCGLIMVDHIHFQYNGMMYGILLISISHMMKGNFIYAALWFTILLNMKHIYIYLAPAYFIYLLKHYCINGKLNITNVFSKNCLNNLLKLGTVVIAVFVITFLPFYDHLGQVFLRLFPFKRGLCHAYWAPNIWAIYNVVDKFAYILASKLNLNIIKSTTKASMTGGLVQEFSYSVLPNVLPITTMVLTLTFMIPAMVKLWNLDKKPIHFLRCLVLCGLTSYLFGWHVHEKAILMAIIPLSLLSTMEVGDAKIFLVLATVGHYSLFPLLFPSSLTLIKALLLILHSTYAFHSLYKIYPLAICHYSLPLLNQIESVYILGLVPLFLYEHVIHYLIGGDKFLPFLPLMLTSLYCSIGVVYCWVKYYIYFLNKNSGSFQAKQSKKVK